MLINWAKEENEGGNSAHASPVCSGYHSYEYQTASELFDYMARHHNFNVEANNPLTTRDLVILYENIEIGTKLLSNASQVKRRLPNQLVETIVYNDDVSDSDVSENYSNEDLLHMCRTNTETMELLNCTPVPENTLCHKIGNIKLKNNHLNYEYDRYFLLDDLQLKTQLKNITLTSRECNNTIPTSLIDYLCCKRLEDNYNIYMDNIIRYVTHTIEQLKRISNGDYLTEKAKQKWREVPENKGQIKNEKDMKVLATSTSFPLRIETKVTGLKSMWDDIVHSEMDIKSLTKILEKKLIIEVPKLICGSYTLLSKQCADNLIISCESRDPREEDKESRVDVVLQLERSRSGQIVSNINSIMILQASTSAIPLDCIENKPMALPCSTSNFTSSNGIEPGTLAIESLKSDRKIEDSEGSSFVNTPRDNEKNEGSEYEYENEHDEILAFTDCEDMTSSLPIDSTTDSTPNLKEMISYSEASLLHTESTSSRLHMTMQNLEVLDTLPEEPVKKKSATKVRIRSPYANNSHVIEEKKRKKLLEIKERREKRKMAFNESCKISKNKYGKGTITPQAANSVTKLSITNKSFYNSIYGHFAAENNRFNKKGRFLAKKDSVPEISVEENGASQKKNVLSPENKNSLKFIDRSYYLDNTITAMDLQKKPETDRKSDCLSEESSSTKLLNMNILSELIESFTDSIEKVKTSQNEAESKVAKFDDSTIVSDSTTSAEPWSEGDSKLRNKTIATLDCRKSIEKIYCLMNKSDKTRNSSNKPLDTLLLNSDSMLSDSASTIHDTKNRPSSNSNKMLVITKSLKEDNKTRINKNNVTRKITPDNPLKTISQLLHEFDNVKKNRLKAPSESKEFKKQLEIQNDSKLNTRSSRRRPQTDEQINARRHTDRFSHSNLTRDKRVNRSTPNVDSGQILSPKKLSPIRTPKRTFSPKTLLSPKNASHEDTDKKIADLIDEVKEAKGEAVKGPPRLNSARLNALAQPKKCYVKAHSEEYQSRYGRNLMADRLDRLAGATDRHNVRNRPRRFNEPLSNTPQKTNIANQPLDTRIRSSPRTRSPAKQNPGVASARDTIKVINVEETKNSKREIVVPLDLYTRPMKLSSVKEELVKSGIPHVPQDWSDNNNSPESKICSLVDESQGSSLTNSSEMGLMIHKYINNIIKTDFVVTSYDEPCGSIGRKTESLLGTDSEDFEYPTLDTPKTTDNESCLKKSQNINNTVSPTSTVVEYFSDSSHSHYTPYESSLFKDEDNFTASGSGGIDKELEKLEHALTRKMSNSMFQSRLRMKTLTLTPIQSSQQTMIVESGDASSLAVQKKASRIIDLHTINPYETSISEATSFRKQTRPNGSWGFTHTQIPMQLYTVGYVLPQYNTQIAVRPMEVRRIRSNISCKTNEINKDLKPPLQIKLINQTFASLPKSEALEKENEIKVSDPKVKKLEVPIKVESNQKGCLEQKSQASVGEKSSNDKNESEKCRDKQIIEKKPMNQSNSLDILVGLLSEIKKLTECQTQITERDHIFQNKHENIKIFTPKDCKKEQQESVENIFNNASKFNKKRDLLLVHQVETDTSLDIPDELFHHSQSITKKLSLIDIKNRQAIYIDKKVSVDLIDKDLVNKTTDIPSQICNITVTRSTTFTQSMTDIFEQSLRSPRKRTSDFSLLYVDSLKPSEKVIELQNYDYETDDSKQTDILEAESEIAKVETDAAKEIKDMNKELAKITAEIEIQTQEHCGDSVDVINVTQPIAHIKQVSKAIKKPTKREISNENPLETKVGIQEPIAVQTGFVVKLKRDVLVTVYSILVITIFAALSLPELLYHI